jgi:pimeloyl-ACP methyl ester carboxylesterase
MNSAQISAAALLLIVANGLSGCATPSRGEHTSRWNPEAPTQTVEVQQGLTLRYLRVGQGQPLVLLHTVRTQLDYFQKLVPLLQDDYTVYVVDLPGHGQSTIARVDYTEKLFRDAIAQFIEKLDLRDVVLAGESIGGVLALTVATEVPNRITRIVSINPYDYGESFGGGIRRSSGGWIIGFFSIFGSYTIEPRFLLDTVLEGAFHDPTKLPAELAREFYRTGLREDYRWVEYSVFKNWRTWVDARELYPKIKAPVTLVYSHYDWSTPAEWFRNQKVIPKVDLVQILDAGHFSSLERPREIANVILGKSSIARDRISAYRAIDD